MKLVEQEIDHLVLKRACQNLFNGRYAIKKIKSKQRFIKTSNLTKNMDDSFMEQTSIELYTDLETSLWRFHIALSDSNPISLDQEIVLNSLFLGEKIVAAITDRTMPLKIILEFKGLPKRNDIQKSEYYLSKLRSSAHRFAEWAVSFRNYKVTEEEKNNISTGQFKLLRKDTLKLYNKFWDIILDHWNIIYKHDTG